jgi:nitrilase
MAGDVYPRFRAAAVQAAPVFLDREATISRLADWVAKARDVGADLVVFGESFIPAFPLWNMLYAPFDQHAFYRRLFENAVEIPGPQVEQLEAIARRHGVVLSVGVTEKGPVSMGAMWNTNLIFGTDGPTLEPSSQAGPDLGREADLVEWGRFPFARGTHGGWPARRADLR